MVSTPVRSSNRDSITAERRAPTQDGQWIALKVEGSRFGGYRSLDLALSASPCCPSHRRLFLFFHTSRLYSFYRASARDMAAPQHQETALSPSSPSFPDGPIALPISPDEELPSKAIPWRIILPVMLYRMTDGMGYLFIFPFITALITSFDVDPGRIGLYSGIAEGTTMLTEAIMATVWAKLSSKYQRRYLLIGGLIICILPTALLGVTSKVWHVVLIRGISESEASSTPRRY